MQGGKKDGLIPLSVKELFNKIDQTSDRKFEISVQYIEIYNEQINDLIDASNKNLEIRESISEGIYINKLSHNRVQSVEEVMYFMQKGGEIRNMAATKLNEVSSRSHTVFRINIKSFGEKDSKVKLS